MVTDESHLSGANPINTHFPRQFGKFETYIVFISQASESNYEFVSISRFTCVYILWVSSSVIDNCIFNL